MKRPLEAALGVVMFSRLRDGLVPQQAYSLALEPDPDALPDLGHALASGQGSQDLIREGLT